jgi:hypothetical protein
MSNHITRSQFVRELGDDGGSVNINDLPPELRQKLIDAGIDAAELRRIAGPDAQVQGAKELGALFDLLDHVDSDGSSDSFVFKQSTANVQPTAAGAAYQKLKEEVASRRQAAHSQGIVHLGMRPASSQEVIALRAETPPASGGVHSIKAYASDDKIDYDGRRFDLGTDAGRESFRDALIAGPDRVPAVRADALVDQLGRAGAKTRDELAQLALSLHRIGTGDLAANRLVISGHGSGRSVSGDGTSGWIEHQTIRDIARLFPEGAGKVQHLALSSCFSAKPNEVDEFRRDFPNLKSFWGYSLTSPLAESGAPAHLRTWASRTDGGDPSAVDPSGKNAASWNIADGEQRFPSVTWADAQNALRASEGVWTEYQTGRHTGSRRTRSPAGSVLPGPAECPFVP